MKTRKNFPSNIKARREQALYNIDKRIKMGDGEVLSIASDYYHLIKYLPMCIS